MDHYSNPVRREKVKKFVNLVNKLATASPTKCMFMQRTFREEAILDLAFLDGIFFRSPPISEAGAEG